MTILPFPWSLLCIMMPCLPNELKKIRLTVALALGKCSGEPYTDTNDLANVISIAANLNGNKKIVAVECCERPH